METRNNFEYLIGYLDKVIRPLFLILPRMSRYVNPNYTGGKVKWLFLHYKFLVTHPNFLKLGDFHQNFSGINILTFVSKFELVFPESPLFYD